MESKYSCLIVDDEYPAHDVIEALLKPYSNLKCTKNCYNGEDALLEINEKHYDIVFLDINMPIINGIELLSKIESKPAIIVTTAYTNFAFEAYENDAVDYLQKPMSPQRFDKAIQKAIDYIEKRKTSINQFITLKIDGFKQKINQNTILYCQSMGNYTKFFIQNYTKPILVHNTLIHHLNILNQDLFIQIHRSYVINYNFISRKKDNTLILLDEIELPIGRKFMPIISSLVLK